MCFHHEGNNRATGRDWAFAAMSFVLVCFMAVGLAAIKEAVSPHPSIGAQQIIQAGRMMVEQVGR